MTRLRKSKQGFTLVELLVVMAIIAILTAIVVPNVVKYIRKGRVTRAQAEVKSIELSLVRMITDADRNNLSHLFNPGGVDVFLSRFGDPITDAAARMEAAQYLYTNTFYALLREGRAALTDSFVSPDIPDSDKLRWTITFGDVLDGNVVKKLGTSYLADIRTDPWGNLYQIYPGPWPARMRLTDLSISDNPNMFRIYQVEKQENLPGSKGGGRPDALTLVDRLDSETGLTETFGYAAPRDSVAFIWSIGENMVSGQVLYNNVGYIANDEGQYPEQDLFYKGGGDDINNWDSGRSWERLYN